MYLINNGNDELLETGLTHFLCTEHYTPPGSPLDLPLLRKVYNHRTDINTSSRDFLRTVVLFYPFIV